MVKLIDYFSIGCLNRNPDHPENLIITNYFSGAVNIKTTTKELKEITEYFNLIPAGIPNNLVYPEIDLNLGIGVEKDDMSYDITKHKIY